MRSWRWTANGAGCRRCRIVDIGCVTFNSDWLTHQWHRMEVGLTLVRHSIPSSARGWVCSCWWSEVLVVRLIHVWLLSHLRRRYAGPRDWRLPIRRVEGVRVSNREAICARQNCLRYTCTDSNLYNFIKGFLRRWVLERKGGYYRS